MDTETIQLQAIRLEYGDQFTAVYDRTTSFVKSLIAKPWWVNQSILLNGEGPLSKMTEHCLIYEIEKGNRMEGYKAYTAYLTLEYGSHIARHTKHADIQALDGIAAIAGDPASLKAEPPVKELVGEIPKWLSKEQADFLYMHSKAGIPETAAMTGMSETAAWSRYRAIRAKIRYHG